MVNKSTETVPQTGYLVFNTMKSMSKMFNKSTEIYAESGTCSSLLVIAKHSIFLVGVHLFRLVGYVERFYCCADF